MVKLSGLMPSGSGGCLAAKPPKDTSQTWNVWKYPNANSALKVRQI